MDWVLILRLVFAGLFGGLIGLEREIRAKEAGIRTHFIVALGSALFMIISQYAFDGQQHDAARVAAQVVSGIGFIGAGVIIFQKNAIRGVTTAAGLWVAAAIGLATGAGLYPVSIAATILTVICLETMNFVHSIHGEKVVHLTLNSGREEDILEVLEALKNEKIQVDSYTMENGKVHLTLRMKQRTYFESIKTIISRLEGFKIEDLN
ncbi:MAG: MgtC/SapB family protein [Bacteroidales bacterium]|nr:MgtC/SapB family protein [Bacteroidales bacterium]